MLKPLPESTRIRCPHRVLMPRYKWSADGELIRLTDESLNPSCAVCAGPLALNRRTARQNVPDLTESTDTEILEAANV